MDGKVKKEMPIEDLFAEKEERILLPLMLVRSMSISSQLDEKAAKSLFERRKAKGQAPAVLHYDCSESWSPSFEAIYGFNHKVNRVFDGDGGIANQVVEFVYDEKAGKPLLVPKATLAYFLEHLAHKSKGATLQVYITGHTDCGGIKAAQGDYSKEALALRSKLDSLKVAIGSTIAELRGREMEKGVRNALLAQANLDFQVKEVLKSGKSLYEQGRLLVASNMRDIEGVYGDRFGDCYLVNLNGDTNPDSIRKHGVLQDVPQKVLSEKVKRVKLL